MFFIILVKTQTWRYINDGLIIVFFFFFNKRSSIFKKKEMKKIYRNILIDNIVARPMTSKCNPEIVFS